MPPLQLGRWFRRIWKEHKRTGWRDYRFTDPDVFRQHTDALVDALQQVAPSDGYDAVRVQGQQRAQVAVERQASGIALPAEVIQQLFAVVEELGVVLPTPM